MATKRSGSATVAAVDKVDSPTKGKHGGKRPGSGRKAGVPNKVTMAAKEAFRLAFEKSGGAEALAEWAAENRTEFYKLYSRLIPVDLTTGEKPMDALTWAFGDRKVTF